MGWIYKVTNQINGKMYIGKTEYLNPIKRWKEHCKDYKRRKMEKRPLYNAMNKYGLQNFVFEPIEQVENGDELCEREMYYIDKFRTYVGFKDCNGYNGTLGGDGKAYLNLNEEEVIRVHIEHNYIAGQTAKIFGCDADTIQKILNKYDIKWLSRNEVAEFKFLQQYGGLVQMNLSKDKILQIYNLPKFVYKKYPDYKESGLSDAYRLNHKTHKYKGYTWYRLNELPEEYKPLLDEYYNSQTSPN